MRGEVVTIKGTRHNVAGLLRLMADEVEQDGRSRTSFSAKAGWDPTVIVEALEADQPYDTTVEIR